jgi:hypothetical protein
LYSVESRFLLSHSQLKSPSISTHFQRPLKELEKPISAARRRRQIVDGFSNEKEEGAASHTPQNLQFRGPELSE